MIVESPQKIKVHNLNKKLLEIDRDFNDEEAKASLAEFLYNNPSFTFEFLADFKLFDFQEVVLLSWLRKNFSLNIWSRGGSKSYLAAIFCIFYCIFNPGVRIVIASSNFRRSRGILETMEKFLRTKSFGFFKACFNSDLVRRNDIWYWNCDNGSSVSALPLASGGGIRGQRADVLIIDEFLLISEEIYNAVLVPFLIAKSGIQDTLKIKEIEDELIKKGVFKEEDRVSDSSIKKIIGLSSASYEFEFLYRKFSEWIEFATKKVDDKNFGSYFVSQLHCDFFPSELIDEKTKNEAKTTMSDSVYNRELGAQFVADSAGYFRASKMEGCTFKDGTTPCVEIIGDKEAFYICGIDTSSSASESSDHFAIDLIKLIPEKKIGALVHNYAVAGADLKQHIKYFRYLLTSFNIGMVIIDGTGGGRAFIQACNESSIFKEINLELKIWDANFDKQEEYIKSLKDGKRTLAYAGKSPVYIQQFSTETIRAMNENLQMKIDRKGIWFGSRICTPLSEDKFNFAKDIRLDILSEETNMIDFLNEQDRLIQLTKDECSLIEVKTTPLGSLVFDLPESLRKSNSPNKTRKDSYTALLLSTWMMKIYYDIQDLKEENTNFVPFMA